MGQIPKYIVLQRRHTKFKRPKAHPLVDSEGMVFSTDSSLIA